MSLSKEQVEALLMLVRNAQNGPLECDHCFEHLAQFAEAELEGRTLCEAMMLVKDHLDACPCCADEYRALLDGLRSLHGEWRGLDS